MASSDLTIPAIPTPVSEFLPYITKNKDSSLRQLLKPYRAYDTKLREVYAQDRNNEILKDPFLNVVPLFKGHESSVVAQARNPKSESEEEIQKYVMPLADEARHKSGSPAIQTSLKDFQANFSVFSEGALADMDWSNVVVAGSAAVTPLMPIPDKYKGSKRALRKYYHEIVAPASDVDLFLYGLTEQEGIEKIKQIEKKIRDAILSEVTIVRTKYAITIASQYPTRHIQIVLRIYGSISEILTGFDVDCACAAYDGKQVYASPRAVVSYMTQINEIDLSRRSPSYENRLSKYSRRGFEIYWENLYRSKVDPTIFERNFPRTVGLARLLVLERLPSSSDRDLYLRQRRLERGRPPTSQTPANKLVGNIKNDWEDEISEWVDYEEVSNYHTFTVPYGPKFNAKKIEKLLYTKDLLLNAEWNQSKARDVHLHRHPAFFGRVEDIVKDCCCECPAPVTYEEKEVAKKDAEIYISGEMKFIFDNPGRQQIGSFNPLTEDDWTEMAYVSNTTKLCHAIVTKDLAAVEEWLKQDGSDPNQRDYTGRTPLHLACMTSSSEIVKCLVDNGARIVARLADGQTALHIASSRGEAEMIKILLNKSSENEEAELEKEGLKRKVALEESKKDGNNKDSDGNVLKKLKEVDSDDKGVDMDDVDEIETADAKSIGTKTHLTSSFVEISLNDDKSNKDPSSEAVPEENDLGPDFYDINVLAWDSPCSPLHLAVINGQLESVRVLIGEYGADVLLPIKLYNNYTRELEGTILPLVLALMLPGDRAVLMTKMLLSLGATPAQADKDQNTPILYAVALCKKFVDVYMETSNAAFKLAVDYVSIGGNKWNPSTNTPLSIAVKLNDYEATKKLLDIGASPEIEHKKWSRSVKIRNAEVKESYYRIVDSVPNFEQNICQPISLAILNENPKLALLLLDSGANCNSLMPIGANVFHLGQSILDAVIESCTKLEEWIKNKSDTMETTFERNQLASDDYYLKDLVPGTYQHTFKTMRLEAEKNNIFNRKKGSALQTNAWELKKQKVQEVLDGYNILKEALMKKEAKKFYDLHPEIPKITKNESDSIEKKTEIMKLDYDFSSGSYRNNYGSYRNGYFVNSHYIELFEAAWVGDIEKIKKLTLAPWGEKEDNDPLEVAVFDHFGNSIYSIAVINGHYEAASEIIKIALQQYSPSKTNVRYSLNNDIDDEESSVDSDLNKKFITSKNEAEVFTIDIADQQARLVKSSNSPIELFERRCQTYQNHTFVKGEDKKENTRSKYFEYIELYTDDEEERIRKKEKNKDCDKAPFPAFIYTNLLSHAMEKEDLKMFNFVLNGAIDCSKDPKLVAAKTAAQQAEHANTYHPPAPMGPISTIYIPPTDVFDAAFKNKNKKVYLAKLMKLCGSGLPLDVMLNRAQKKIASETKNNVKMDPQAVVKNKSQFYQGLMVYGKKRKDWASRGAGMSFDSSITKLSNIESLLLKSAYSSDAEIVVWMLRGLAIFENDDEDDYEEFFNDDFDLSGLPKPQKLFKDFIKVAKKDQKYKCLAEPTAGFDNMLNSWLGMNSFLVLHSVVMAPIQENSFELLKYLLKKMPDKVDSQSPNGWTPLMIAFFSHHHNYAKLLIENGANQTLRDYQGHNLVHMAIYPPASFVKREQIKLRIKYDSYRKLFGLIDPLIRPSMFVERCMTKPASLTPLHWLILCEHGPNSQINSGDACMRDKDMAQIAETILEFSSGEELDMINGAGDAPLHSTVMKRLPETAKVLVKYRPDMISRENAVGRTPVEIADSLITSFYINEMPAEGLLNQNHRYRVRESIVDKTPANIAEEEENNKKEYNERHNKGSGSEKRPNRYYSNRSYETIDKNSRHLILNLHKIFSEVPEDKVGPRKLVTLHEANEVANRLAVTTAENKSKKTEGEDNEQENEEDSENEEGGMGDDNELSTPEELSRKKMLRFRRTGKIVLRSIEKQIGHHMYDMYRPDVEPIE
jgi:ankyrin repeat protein